MQTRGTNFKEISFMRYGMDEADKMSELNGKWVQTMDLKHDNMLLYPIDVMVEKVEEVYPRKYVNSEDFFTYECENGSHWLVSKSMSIEDIDMFFKNYLHLDEEA